MSIGTTFSSVFSSAIRLLGIQNIAPDVLASAIAGPAACSQSGYSESDGRLALMVAGGHGPYREGPMLLPLPPNTRALLTGIDWRRFMGRRQEAALRRYTFLSPADLRAVFELDSRPDRPAARLIIERSSRTPSGTDEPQTMTPYEYQEAISGVRRYLFVPEFESFRESVSQMDRLYDRIVEVEKQLKSARQERKVNKLRGERSDLVRQIQERIEFHEQHVRQKSDFYVPLADSMPVMYLWGNLTPSQLKRLSTVLESIMRKIGERELSSGLMIEIERELLSPGTLLQEADRRMLRERLYREPELLRDLIESIREACRRAEGRS